MPRTKAEWDALRKGQVAVPTSTELDELERVLRDPDFDGDLRLVEELLGRIAAFRQREGTEPASAFEKTDESDLDPTEPRKTGARMPEPEPVLGGPTNTAQATWLDLAAAARGDLTQRARQDELAAYDKERRMLDDRTRDLHTHARDIRHQDPQGAAKVEEQVKRERREFDERWDSDVVNARVDTAVERGIKRILDSSVNSRKPDADGYGSARAAGIAKNAAVAGAQSGPRAQPLNDAQVAMARHALALRGDTPDEAAAAAELLARERPDWQDAPNVPAVTP
jgi:hypothetical protein